MAEIHNDTNNSDEFIVTSNGDKTEEDLTIWLHEHGVDTSEWGTGTRKTVLKLLEELENKECNLIYENQKAIRCIQVAKVLIKRNNSSQILIEEKEIKPDGKEKKRNSPMSEKMKAGESPIDVGIRGVKEEVGLDCFLKPGTGIDTIVEDEISASYPTLLGRYTVHVMTMIINNISQQSFNTIEQSSIGERTHCWKWVEENEVKLGKGAKPQS